VGRVGSSVTNRRFRAVLREGLTVVNLFTKPDPVRLVAGGPEVVMATGAIVLVTCDLF
jgi:hypothetical protein